MKGISVVNIIVINTQVSNNILPLIKHVAGRFVITASSSGELNMSSGVDFKEVCEC